nr:MAG TPA: protein of unknown function (DUF4428) [Caudoviricetes sp.]
MRTISNFIKRTVTAIVATIFKEKCCVCNKNLGTLTCENGKKICEKCAQYMSDNAPD